MIVYNIKPLMQIRGIKSPSKFLKEIGIAEHTAFRMLRGEVTTLNLDYIEKLCTHLICEPNDLLLYKPSKTNVLPENHPLLKLKNENKNINLNWREKFDNMSIKQLMQFSKQLEQTNQSETKE